MKSICIDGDGRIVGLNPHDLSGNTGWLTTADVISEPLTETHGIPLYKYVDGHVAARTQEEIDTDIAALPSSTAPNLEQRVTDCEADIDQIIAGLEAMT